MVLSESDRNFLLKHAAVRRYRRGHNLFNQGDDATCLFVVLEGEVEIFVDNGQDRTVVHRKHSGAVFGELELLGGQERIASAVTLAESKLGVIRKCAFEQCIATKPELLVTIVRHLAVAIGDMVMRLSISPLDAYGRLRFCLYSLAREANGFMVVQGWTQQQLADFAGCCRKTVSDILCNLKEGQWIQSKKQRITILRPLPEHF
jgi:CRP/FNR family transcriptional regulator, cyclic AMP receptor protein